jgi:hypothetical protein
VKPRGKGFSTRPRGVRRRCIHDPRSMYFARRDRHMGYIDVCWIAGGGRGVRGRSVGTTSTRTDSVIPERRDRDPRTYDVI